MSDLLHYFDDLDPYDLLSDTLYPAPAANEPIADFSNMNIDQITEVLSIDELWRISNSFVRRARYTEALTYIRIALDKDPYHARLKALSGLCYLLLGDYKKAGKEFTSVLKIDSTLDEVRVWSAYIRAVEKKWTSVARHLSLVQNPSIAVVTARALIETWQYYSQQKKSKYSKAIQTLHEYADNVLCSDVLTLHYFSEGKKCIEEGDLVSAARIWQSTFQRDSLSWCRHRSILETLQRYASDRISFLQLRKNDLAYGRMLEKLLHLSLIPEFFEEEKNISERMLYWKQSVGGKGGYPYAHFRYALCLAYMGEIEKAYEELLACRDKIPASKVSFFRIDELIDWARDPGSKEENSNPWTHFFDSASEIESWQHHGFNDPRSAKRWKALGASPAEAREWEQVFALDSHLGFGFYASGFRDPHIAYNWSKHFSVPSDAWECYSNQMQEQTYMQDSVD